MIEALQDAAARYAALEQQLSTPEVLGDSEKYRDCIREYHKLAPLAEKHGAYQQLERQLQQAEELAQDEDAEMRQIAREESRVLREQLAAMEQEIQLLLTPSDPDDERDVIIEIRAGAGGEEAALFCAVLFRMYKMYADKKGWKLELMDTNETELGGYRYLSFTLSGAGVYACMKFESGVHRVQRVPLTESQGRIQTSTATVAVLPQVREVEVEINPADIKMETYRSSGAGGQHINKTDSAVRLIHLPTGTVAECQEERSQFKNRDKALKLLRARLYDSKKREQEAQISATRRGQVGTGDRSERIRTYNYPQSRVTDHRIGLTLHQLESFLNGEMDSVISALKEHAAQEALRDGEEA